MKTKFILFILFLLIAAVSIFVFLNTTKVPIHFTPSIQYELPASFIIIGSIAVGAFFMIVLTVFRELKLTMSNRNLKKQLTAKEKALQSFEKGLVESFLGNVKNAYKAFLNSYKLDNNFIYQLFLKNIEENSEKQEKIINKLPFDVSKFYLMEYYFENKKFNAVIDIAKELLENTNFKNYKYLVIIRDAYKNIEKYNDAIMVQERIINLKNVNKVDEIKILAELNYLNTKKNLNETNINSLIKNFSNFRPAYFLKFNFIKNSKPYDALQVLKDGYKNCKNDTVFLCVMAKLALENNDEKIRKDIEKLLGKFKSENAAILQALVSFYNNNTEKSENIIKEYINKNKLAAIIYAEILYRKNHDLKDSIEVFRKILNTDSGIKITFKCDFCSFVTEEWDDYCPECKRFDALKCNI
jgi:uncharacterized integral membrane protein/lipopolysaccharide biosynthesis regulator YciM